MSGLGDNLERRRLEERRARQRANRFYSIPDGRGGRTPLPVEGGVPVRGVLFFAAALAVVVLLAQLPSLGFAVPWVISYVVVPWVAAVVLTRLTEIPPPPPLLDDDDLRALEESTLRDTEYE